MFFDMVRAIMIPTILVVAWSMVVMYQCNHRERRKQYQVAKCRKKLRQLTKLNKRRPNKSPVEAFQGTHSQEIVTHGRSRTHILRAPNHLSIFDDTETAMAYFDNVLSTIKQCSFRDSIFFDLSEVEIITPDAIMYLIAVIKNMRRVRLNKIKCSGNMPKSDSARKIIESSGFLTYVSSVSTLRDLSDNQYMKISSGNDANPRLASSFCDFVQCACEKTSLKTKRLYPMIIELMTNTHQHAYNPKETAIMISNWYVFAQDVGKYVHFIFLDTGLGIPKTIYRKFPEKLKELLVQSDTEYLKSVLMGVFRSETRQEHRGKGLPGIYEDACNMSIAHLSIISGRAKCTVTSNKQILTETFKQAFEGTLFTWDILKEDRVC